MDTEKDILYCFNSNKRAMRELSGAMFRLCNNDEIKKMISRRFGGRMTYYNQEIGICAEILLTPKAPPQNDVWVYNIYELNEKGQIASDTPIRSGVNYLGDFTLDELACFVKVFERGHKGQGLHLQIRTQSDLDEISAIT